MSIVRNFIAFGLVVYGLVNYLIYQTELEEEDLDANATEIYVIYGCIAAWGLTLFIWWYPMVIGGISLTMLDPSAEEEESVEM